MSDIFLVLGIVFSLALAIVLMVVVAPAKKRDQLTGFAGWLNDLFNFRTLFIEKILKFLYILATCFCLVGGLFTLLSAIGVRYGGGTIALTGLLLMVAGPIAIRLSYEFLMMLILLVTNVLEINRKLNYKGSSAPAAPVVPTAPAPKYVFCTQCGTKYDERLGHCPNCGKR